MRRPAYTILALLACSVIGGCKSQHGLAQTSLLVVNHTGQPIAVSYSQEAANAEANPITVDQQVLPEHSVRFSGLEGDRILIRAGSDPEMVVEYARRSQVVSVLGGDGAVRYEVHKGFNE